MVVNRLINTTLGGGLEYTHTGLADNIKFICLHVILLLQQDPLMKNHFQLMQ
jgi:hypothetical protein